IDEVEHNPSFGPHNKIEIAQTDVEVDDYYFFSHLRERRTERGCRSCLTDAAFSRRHDQDFGHSYLLSRLIQRCDFHDFAVAPRLRRSIAQGRLYFFSSLIVTVDSQQFRLDLLTKNPRP